MRITHGLIGTAVTLSLTAAAIVGPTSGVPAQAAGPRSPTTPGAHTYTFTLAAESSTQSTGVLAWDNTTWALTLTANTGQLASGSCVTV